MSNLIFPTPSGISPKVTRAAVDSTSIQNATSGRELRLNRSDRPRWRYQVAFPYLRASASYQELQAMESFIRRHSGRYDSFLWNDAEDNSVTAHGFGVGTGVATAFQLQRTRGGNFSDVVGTWPTYDQPRTNLLTYSTDYSNAAWTKTAATVAGATVWAPDGSLNADTISDTAANFGHGVNTSATVVTSTVYTYSVVLQKGATYDTCRVSNPSEISVSAVFNLATGAITSTAANCTSAMTSLGGGWYVCSITFTATFTPALLYIDMNGGATYAGGTGKLNVWQSQLERGPVPTQPIVTTSAAVTATPAYWPAATDGFEPVTEPMPGISVYSAGVLKTPGTDYTLGAGTGIITFTSAPASGAALTWSGSFRKRVRFDEEAPSFDRIVEDLWSLGTLDLISVI